ncbi:unnamed protein product [Protopolystoma xenopodis]|uniref:Uncharacterized protein n=1 Tax=Protopolystoma xenopodis TaxID=117903 RepID=A0A3S5CGR0_9PLAT|nr:unnamed protein product [Protopolystoma xenopodis]
MLPRADDVHHMTDKSLASFHRNQRRLPRKQRRHESSSKAHRQLVKRNPPSFSGGTDRRISSPNTFTRNGSFPAPLHCASGVASTRFFQSAILFLLALSESPSCPAGSFSYLPGSVISLDRCRHIPATRGVMFYTLPKAFIARISQPH